MTDRLGNSVKLGDIVIVPRLAGYDYGVVNDLGGQTVSVWLITESVGQQLDKSPSVLTVIDGDLFSRPNTLGERLLAYSNLVLESEDARNRLLRFRDGI